MELLDPTSGFFECVPMACVVAEMALDETGRAVDWRYERCNAEWERLTGCPRTQVEGRLAKEALPVVEQEWIDAFARTVETSTPTSITWTAESFAGRWFEARAFPLGGRRFGVAFVEATQKMQELAERKRAEGELQSALRLLQTVFREAPAFLCVMSGPEHIFEMANERYLQLVGERDLIGRTVAEAIPEVVGQGFLELLGGVYSTGEPFVGTDVPIMLARSPGGPLEQRFVDFIYIPLRDAGGKVSGVFAHGVDQTERKRSEDGLRALAAELSDSDRRKSEFLATLAHELRNPLAPLRNGLQIMRMAPSDAGAIARARDMMERQVSNLVRLVDDLMDVARISGGKIELRIARTTLQSALAAAVETALPAIEAQRHALNLDVPAEPIPVEIDATRIGQVFGNILANAAKYTPSGGRIELSAGIEGSEVVIEISDDGVGIAPEALPTVFDMFAQVRDTAAMAQGGLGIGLSLVRKLVELHGGSVSATSAGLCRGSSFAVRLPVAAEIGREQIQQESHTATLLVSRLKVLVVDDNLDAGDSLALRMEMAGHEVALARDGIDGLAVAKTFKPDLAFLDIGMPGMDGYELARAIRSSSECAGTRLIALTGWGARRDVERAMEAGFDDHLTKPAQGRDIDEALARAASAQLRI